MFMDEKHACQNDRVAKLLAEIKRSRADYEREVGSRRKLLASIHAEIEARQDPDSFSDAEHEAILRGQLARRDLEHSDLRREVGGKDRLIADLRGEPSQGPPTELEAQIEDSWQRLCADFRRYREQTGYPEPKGGRRGR